MVVKSEKKYELDREKILFARYNIIICGNKILESKIQ